MLESLNAKQNARWKWRNIFFFSFFWTCRTLCQCYLEFNDLQAEGWQVKAGRGVWQSWPGHHHLSPPPFSILFHQLTRQMAPPASVTQKAISVLPDPARADRVRERGRRRKEPTEAFFNTGFFFLFFFLLWSISVLLVKVSRTAQLLGWLGELLGKGVKSECGKNRWSRGAEGVLRLQHASGRG